MDGESIKAQHNTVGAVSFYLCPVEIEYDEFLINMINFFADECGMKYVPQLKNFSSKVKIPIKITQRFEDYYHRYFLAIGPNFGGYIGSYYRQNINDGVNNYYLRAQSARSMGNTVCRALISRFKKKPSLAVVTCSLNNIFTIIER